MDKETLLAECDFLSLHCPLSDLSRNFIDKEALEKIKEETPSLILLDVVMPDSDGFELLKNESHEYTQKMQAYFYNEFLIYKASKK